MNIVSLTEHSTKLIQELLGYHRRDAFTDNPFYREITDPSLKDTPARFAKMLQELASGYLTENGSVILNTTFEDDIISGYDGMVIVKDIPLHSLCEHHLAPFIGKAHIGYIPNGKVAGLSKFSRLTEIYARRLQVQERLTLQIANDIMQYLQPLGCGVVIEAMHTCMCMRGTKALGSSTTTSIMRGVFFDNLATRMEFLHYFKS